MVRKAGITRKTFLFAAMLIMLVTLVSFAILFFAMPSYYLHKKEQALKDGTGLLTEALKNTADKDECAALIAAYCESYNVMVTSLDANGIPVIDLTSPFVSLKNSGAGEFIINGEVVGEADFNSVITKISEVSKPRDETEINLNISTENVGAYIMFDIGTDLFLEACINSVLIDSIQIQGTLQPISESRGVILSMIPYVLAAGSAIGFVLAWFYARQITKPILRLSDAAERMKQMEPDAASGIRTSDELGQLSENMDALYQSLSETIMSLKTEMNKVNRLERSKTEMMQSASHELKTPIAALSGMLDGMIDNIGVYKDKERYLLKCKEQVEKLSFLVKEILDASKSDDRALGGECGDVEVDTMVRHILTEQDYLIREKGIQVREKLQETTIRTEASSFYRAIANLIGNAVRYTPEGGAIRITLTDNRLDIENDCAEIGDEELPKLFEPFYTRSGSRDKSESGTGLGLYIVKRNLERLSIPYQVRSTSAGFGITLDCRESNVRGG